MSPQANSRLLETNPERTGERPRTVKGLAHHEHTGRYQREERALRLLKSLLTPQGKALLEDFNPCCRRVSCKLVVEFFQDAILLSDNLLNCPSSVQRWCVMVLAPGEQSENRPMGEQVAEDLEPALDSS